MNLIQALNTGYNLLKSSKINSYKIDTEILLSASLKISKEKMILNLNKEISFEDYENFLKSRNLSIFMVMLTLMQLFAFQGLSRIQLKARTANDPLHESRPPIFVDDTNRERLFHGTNVVVSIVLLGDYHCNRVLTHARFADKRASMAP